MFTVRNLLENGMVLDQARYDRQMWGQEPEEEVDPYDSDLLATNAWDFISRDEETELDFYRWVYSDKNIVDSRNTADELAILRKAYQEEKEADPTLTSLESDYCFEADGWIAFIREVLE